MIHVYSLADYQLTIGIPENIARNLNLRDSQGNLLTAMTIGGPGENGEGSFVGSLSVQRTENLWNTEGDATGSWYHNKNLNKTGTMTLSLNYISEQTIELYQLFSIFESIQENSEGLTLTINTNASEETTALATGNDCYISKPANLDLQDTSQPLSWEFTCGQIFFYQ